MRRPETFITIKRAAGHLGVPVAWLRREAEANLVPSLLVGRRLMIDLEAAEAALRERALLARAVEAVEAVEEKSSEVPTGGPAHA